jgi:hypothetical protein
MALMKFKIANLHSAVSSAVYQQSAFNVLTRIWKNFTWQQTPMQPISPTTTMITPITVRKTAYVDTNEGMLTNAESLFNPSIFVNIFVNSVSLVRAIMPHIIGASPINCRKQKQQPILNAS